MYAFSAALSGCPAQPVALHQSLVLSVIQLSSIIPCGEFAIAAVLLEKQLMLSVDRDVPHVYIDLLETELRLSVPVRCDKPNN